jgi:hypothetical protein
MLPGRVTLLGDAIHTITPFQGLAGDTALVDAMPHCCLARWPMPLRDVLTWWPRLAHMSLQCRFTASAQWSSRCAFPTLSPPPTLSFRSVVRLAARIPLPKDLVLRRPTLLAFRIKSVTTPGVCRVPKEVPMRAAPESKVAGFRSGTCHFRLERPGPAQHHRVHSE